MAGKNDKCGCGAGNRQKCPNTADMVTNEYWCEGCERLSPEKRCPLCGLKTRKIRGEAMSQNHKKKSPL
ncbi:MAG TPA: hypothetical protein VGJ93_03555 [Desulfuromonadaceae bacterium]|jgi:rRNA maturation endonuclease Nob1